MQPKESTEILSNGSSRSWETKLWTYHPVCLKTMRFSLKIGQYYNQIARYLRNHSKWKKLLSESAE